MSPHGDDHREPCHQPATPRTKCFLCKRFQLLAKRTSTDAQSVSQCGVTATFIIEGEPLSLLKYARSGDIVNVDSRIVTGILDNSVSLGYLGLILHVEHFHSIFPLQSRSIPPLTQGCGHGGCGREEVRENAHIQKCERTRTSRFRSRNDPWRSISFLLPQLLQLLSP